MRGRLLLGIGLLLALAPAVVAHAATAGAAQKPDEAEPLFRSAFAEQVTPADRVKLLERVVKEQAESPWADDALWVLGEAARRQGLSLRVVYYWQFLISRWPGARLEDYTRTLDVYRLSPAGGVQRVLEAEGTLYTPQPGRVISGKEATAFVYNNAVAFNPVPMLVWEGLGDSYSELAKPDLAAAAYARAVAAAPPAGQWAQGYRERVTQKQTKQQARIPGGSAPAPAAVPALKPAEAPGQADAAHPPAGGPAEPASAPASQAAPAPQAARGRDGAR